MVILWQIVHKGFTLGIFKLCYFTEVNKNQASVKTSQSDSNKRGAPKTNIKDTSETTIYLQDFKEKETQSSSWQHRKVIRGTFGWDRTREIMQVRGPWDSCAVSPLALFVLRNRLVFLSLRVCPKFSYKTKGYSGATVCFSSTQSRPMGRALSCVDAGN